VWSWDITKLAGPAKWTAYHLYVVLDVYSRYAVGWTVAERETSAASASSGCHDCNRPCTRDGLCPHCDEPVTVDDLLDQHHAQPVTT